MILPVCIRIKTKTWNAGMTIMADSAKFFTFMIFLLEKNVCIRI